MKVRLEFETKVSDHLKTEVSKLQARISQLVNESAVILKNKDQTEMKA